MIGATFLWWLNVVQTVALAIGAAIGVLIKRQNGRK